MKKIILPALVLTFFLLMPFALAQIRSVSLVQDPVFGTGQQVLLLSIGTIYSDYANFGTISASASELSQLEPTNAQILNSFTMRWKTEEEYTIYPLNFKRSIYKIDIVSSDYKWWGWSSSDETQWINLNCQDLDGDGKAAYIEKKNVFGAVLQIFCAKRGEYVGDVFTIGSPQPYWKTRFEISNGYETLVDYLGTGIGYAKNINNKVYIRFDGLGLFTYPKVAGDTYVFTNYAKINLFDADYLSGYENALTIDAQYYVNQVANGQMSEATAETLINSKISPITSTWTTNQDFPYNSISWVGSTKYDIRLKYTSTERISFQNFVVYANSNFIQIKIPYGQPKILSVYTDFGSELIATKEGRVTAVIQNVGNDIATFEATLSCQQSSVFSPTQIISNINAQESRTLTWDVNAKQTDSLISDTCTLKVCDTTKTTNCDTKTISFSIKPRPVCTPGEQYASLEYNIWKVYECGSDGKYYLKFSCNPGEVPYKDQWGKYVGCQAEQKPGVSPQPQPTPIPFKIENWMWGALIGLLAFFLLGGASGLINKQYDKVGIAAIIGLIAFIIVYSVLEWWSGLAWWQKLLVSLGIIGGAGGMIYLLFALGIFGTVIAAIVSLLKKR
jgi:hypothetical protein